MIRDQVPPAAEDWPERECRWEEAVAVEHRSRRRRRWVFVSRTAVSSVPSRTRHRIEFLLLLRSEQRADLGLEPFMISRDLARISFRDSESSFVIAWRCAPAS